MSECDKIKVSIFCLTYNHKDYIRDALEGFLAQETDFKYDIYIYDDASTDGTSDIVREYALRYPQLITAEICENNTFNDPEIGKKQAQIRTKMRGEYIALCEGDDYWIDSHKLQIQVDYMDKHQECSLTMHNSICWNYDNMTIQTINAFGVDIMQEKLKARDLIIPPNWHPATASFLYRKEYEPMPDLFYESSVGDYPLYLYMFTRGNIFYDSRIMSVYRWHTPKSYSEVVEKNEERNTYFYMGLIKFLFQYDEYTEYKYHDIMLDRLQGIVSAFLENLDSNRALEDYIQKSNDAGYKKFDINQDILNRMEQLKRQILDTDYCSIDIMKYCEAHEEMWVMGTGKYASIVSEQLNNNQVEIKGYAVSNIIGTSDTFRGKMVVETKSLCDKNVGVIVAINPVCRKNLIEAIEQAGIKDYFNPFVFVR